MPDIIIQPTNHSRINDVDFSNIVFGKEFADHMFVVDYDQGVWKDARIVPYGNLSLSPALSCMHYGQAIFEGMKAYKNDSNELLLFRAEDNWKRLNISAERMCMPELPYDVFMKGLVEWLKLDQEWVPSATGSSLYIRPFMFATDDFLGVKPSNKYSFIIYGCPVNAYYSTPLKIKIERKFVRAVQGGVGYAKAAGNYAAAMYPASLAQKEGYHQLLWTDAFEHEYLEELGTSNFFMLVDNKLLTPALTDTILNGITRDSVIKIARHFGVEVEERRLSVTELRNAAAEGRLQEAFATGTAAAIARIETICIDGIDYNLKLREDALAVTLLKALEKIKRGGDADFESWVERIN
jgi:branched-chain amino acid aminotransferase